MVKSPSFRKALSFLSIHSRLLQDTDRFVDNKYDGKTASTLAVDAEHFRIYLGEGSNHESICQVR